MIKTQIILAGIGGQGILFASRIFSELGLKLGLNVLGSETHGMSQRGGSVLSHLKLGNFHSPLIHTGAADILYSFAEEETYRSLKFLRNGGVCFVNLENSKRFDPAILSHLKGKKVGFRTFDANEAAAQIGFARSTNIVLIGYSVGTGLIPFVYDDIKSALESVSRKKELEVNLKAFEIGFLKGKS
ncbi:MAG: indolepyruvate oxidoreductase subunit beta [Candidatus Aminicenantes bacterium]|nr:MAG: indolepyruvate oxidoreductase subunit beta [Candidatus Aminicenantes bacterium]